MSNKIKVLEENQKFITIDSGGDPHVWTVGIYGDEVKETGRLTPQVNTRPARSAEKENRDDVDASIPA